MYIYFTENITRVNSRVYGAGQVAEFSTAVGDDLVARGKGREASTEERDAHLAGVEAIEDFQANGLESVVTTAVVAGATEDGDTLEKLEDRIIALEEAP